MNIHIAPPTHLFSAGLFLGTMVRAIHETPQIVAEIAGALTGTGVTDIAERAEVQGRNARSSIGVLLALAGVPAAAVGREDLAAALFGIVVGMMIFDQTLEA